MALGWVSMAGTKHLQLYGELPWLQDEPSWLQGKPPGYSLHSSWSATIAQAESSQFNGEPPWFQGEPHLLHGEPPWVKVKPPWLRGWASMAQLWVTVAPGWASMDPSEPSCYSSAPLRLQSELQLWLQGDPWSLWWAPIKRLSQKISFSRNNDYPSNRVYSRETVTVWSLFSWKMKRKDCHFQPWSRPTYYDAILLLISLWKITDGDWTRIYKIPCPHSRETVFLSWELEMLGHRLISGIVHNERCYLPVERHTGSCLDCPPGYRGK